MAQDYAGVATRGPTNRQALKPAVHRIVPAIPHALDLKRRPRQLQTTQAGEADSNSEPPSISVHEPTPVQDEEDVNISTVAGVVEAAAPEEINGFHKSDAHDESHTAQNVPNKVQDNEDLKPHEKLNQSEVAKGHVSLPESPKIEVPSPSTTMEPPVPPQDNTPEHTPRFLSAHRSNASSATSTSLPQDPTSESGTMQQPRLVPNSLIFGGHRESGNTSPVPSAAQGLPPFTQSSFASYSGQGSNSASFYPTVQAYPGSELPGPPMLPPAFVPNAGGPGGHRDFYHQAPPQFHPSRPFQSPVHHFSQAPRRPEDLTYQHRYAPPPPRANGYSQAMQDFTRVAPTYGQASSTHPDMIPGQRQSNDGNRQPDHSLGSLGQQPDGERGIMHTSERMFLPSLDDNAAVARYILGQFGNREFADYVVYLSHGRYLFPPATLAAHGVILARSPKLRSLMVMQHGGYQAQQVYPKFLNVILSDRFLGHDLAFMKALMRLYGEPLPDNDFISKLPNSANQQGPETGEQEAMRFALTYAAAGHFLQMDEIIMHGLNVAAGLLTWETVSSALAFAMEGGLSSTFVQFEAAAEDKGSNSSFDEMPTKLESPVSTPTYGIYSDRMLHSVVSFLIRNCPLDFKLLETAPQLYEIARLPAVGEPNHSRSNSRFSQIRFGDMTMEEEQLPDVATTMMSSTLLSLPYLLLKHVLESGVLGERLGWPKVAEIIRAVIQEREQRRQRAMASRGSAVPYSGVEERLWRNVRWVESVDLAEQLPSGLRLSRHVVGVETPVSGSSNKSAVL